MPSFVASIEVYFDAPSQESADTFTDEIADDLLLASEAVTAVTNSGAREAS